MHRSDVLCQMTGGRRFRLLNVFNRSTRRNARLAGLGASSEVESASQRGEAACMRPIASTRTVAGTMPTLRHAPRADQKQNARLPDKAFEVYLSGFPGFLSRSGWVGSN